MDFLDMIYEKRKTLTPHTYVQGTIDFNYLSNVEPIGRLNPRIFVVINELMSHCWHNVAHHVGSTTHRNGFLWPKILIMIGFMNCGSSLMGPIKT
jgi:hypothetical protein